MRLISLKLPEALASELEHEARGRSVPRSRLIREAVADYLGRHRAPRKRSVLEVAGDLVGSVEGLEDLATNPAYRAGYGQ